MTATTKQNLLYGFFGMLLCFAVTSIWSIVVVRLWGHTGREQPLATALALVVVIEAAMAIAFWKRWRAAAIGVLVYIGGEAVWVFAAWLVFQRP